MANVVARFFVSEVTKRAGGGAALSLRAVTSKENARWSQYTPSGQITMDLTRKASGALAAFEERIGQECLVTFAFDPPPSEEPEYRREGDPDELGYVSDE